MSDQKEETERMKDELSEGDAMNAEVDLDDSKAKFLNGGKGMDDDTHVVVSVSDSPDTTFQGLGKEDLMKYVNDPFWKRLRIILFVMFWVGWLAMLAAAIIIIVLAPRCPYRPDLKWYHKEAVYNTVPKSFKDSDGDGIGDIKGLKSEVSYIKRLGAKAISFGSIFKQDADGAIIDYKDVDPTIATLKDVEQLLSEYKKTGPKIILDFIPNHTSRNHTWFVESRKSKDNDFAKYYVWADEKNGGPPNNWKNINGQSAWALDSTRNQYYLAQKGPQYPDLNLMDEDVREEMRDILTFWLGKGVGGFNLQDAHLLVENSSLADEDKSGPNNTFTVHNPDNHDVIHFFRGVINSFSDKPGRERVLLAVIDFENAPVNSSLAYYGTAEKPGLHIVVNKQMSQDLSSKCNAICVKNLVEASLTDDAATKWLGWMLGNQDTSRISERMGMTHEIAALVLQMMLPGTPIMYYGDEVGMKDGTAPNFATSPMQWTPDKNAGFTSGTPWIRVNSDYKENNVASEEAHFKESNVLSKVKELLKLRGEESIQFGSITTGISEDMFWFVRKATGFPSYLVAINFGSGSVDHLFKGDDFAGSAKIVFHSHEKVPDGTVDIASRYVNLGPGHAIVIELS